MNEIHSIQNKDTVISEPQQIADTFINHFISIANTICSTVKNDKNETSTNKTYLNYFNNSFKKPFSKIKWNYVTTYEVTKIIKSLKQKKVCGYDEVPIKIVKLSAPYIISPITYICNQSLISGVFSDKLKYSIIKPIYKKGDKLHLTNYRPKSLLTSFSKIFERRVYERLYKHICTNKILVEEQFGFKSDSSTEKASYKLINEILQAMNNKFKVGGILYDLEKAFHCINHTTLLDKLQFYGIKGKFLE
jgi:hypothetical protein